MNYRSVCSGRKGVCCRASRMISRLASNVWHLVGGVRVWECSICHTCNPMFDVFCRKCCPVREPIKATRPHQLSLFPEEML